MQTTSLIIPAMHNEAVAFQVANALDAVKGVVSVHITLARRQAQVGFDEQAVSAQQLESAVAAAGFVVGDAPAGCGCASGGCGR
jgi:copper chaperone CopZ